MSIIQENLTKFSSHIRNTKCKLIAISKTKTNEEILEAYQAGHRDFGENKVQELVAKQEQLPDDICWHMVGHLQRNKVKYIAPFVHLIHSIDSFRLLKEVNKEGAKNDRVINCLLQVHIADEDTKFGFDVRELDDLIASEELNLLKNVRIIGLMGMATFTDNTDQVQKEFTGLNELFRKLQEMNLPPPFGLTELSMGMSGDYKTAIECGSTMVRVGSAIFGERSYQ